MVHGESVKRFIVLSVVGKYSLTSNFTELEKEDGYRNKRVHLKTFGIRNFCLDCIGKIYCDVEVKVIG